jgi:hypothetical protein
MNTKQTLQDKFDKKFSNGTHEPDNTGGVSTMDKVRGTTSNELSRVGQFMAEGERYGGYNPATGRIDTSLTKPPAKTAPKATPPKKARAVAGNTKPAAKPAASKSSKALDEYRATRRLENYKRLFKKRGLKVPPLDEKKPVEACRICEEELKIIATPDIGDQVVLGTIARVEAFTAQRPALDRRVRLRGYTDRVESAMQTHLRHDLDELYIKYDAALALSVETRVAWRLMDIAISTYVANSAVAAGHTTEEAVDAGDQLVDEVELAAAGVGAV